MELPDDHEITAEGVEALLVPAEIVEHELGARSLTRRVVEIAGSLTITASLFVFAIPAISNSGYGEIWDRLADLRGAQFVELTALWLAVMLTYTGVMTAALPGLRHSQALVVNVSGSAVSNVVPFGGAAGVAATYAMELSWGFRAPSITLAILVTGVWNVFTKLGLPVLAVVLLAATGRATTALVGPAGVGVLLLAAGILVFLLVLRSEVLAQRVGGLAERIGGALFRVLRRRPPPWRKAVLDFRHRSVGLIRDRWGALTFWMLVYSAGQFLLLLMCVRAMGADTDELGWIEVFAAYTLANLLTTIAVTPSGVGFVEAGTTAALIAFGGNETGAAAAVFLFRGFTYVMEIPLGALGWAVWGWARSWRRPLAESLAAGIPGPDLP